eukprot:4901251-Pyramimonas_sp.AAC.1
MDFREEIDTAAQTLRSVPRCIRVPFLRAVTQCLVEIERTHLRWDRDDNSEGDCVRAWILLFLPP